MASVILVVFIVQLSLSLISSYGAQAVNDLAWFFFSQLPTPQNKKTKETIKLRNEVIRLQREMIGVSAQDNFAKWARLRRDHDKAKEKYDKEASEQQSFRASFDSIVSKLRWLGTQGVNFVINTWYAKQPMFWLPQGWVPYHAEWVLSLPRAPLGSISVNVWAIACGSVIGMITEAIVASWTMAHRKTPARPGEDAKVPRPASPTRRASKKEL